jgi:hypothetical protein
MGNVLEPASLDDWKEDDKEWLKLSGTCGSILTEDTARSVDPGL